VVLLGEVLRAKKWVDCNNIGMIESKVTGSACTII